MKTLIFLLLVSAAASHARAADCNTAGAVTITPPVPVPATVAAQTSQAERDRAAAELVPALTAAQARLYTMRIQAGINPEAALVAAVNDKASATQAVRTSDGRVLLVR
jgi:hypothetical protein